MRRVRTESSREIYRNAWMSLREDHITHPDGSPGLYAVVDKPACVCVIAVDGDSFHLIEQFRYPLGRRSWEFVQGTWPHEGPPGEELARAELAEETGLRADTLRHLGRISVAAGLTSQECDVFVAGGLTQGPHARESTEQEMQHAVFTRAELDKMLRDGVIADGITLAAYALYLLHTP
ncbi:NUDIX hydrolase [Actinocorallia sp. A-T 12471]|uniref:NUDIX hydrolase n=1 Tax=Actinocorallia sp. A-T 12471 TaxID=3089813 RepID=UPI0029D3DBC3|nr:NUDIX hydrolase [Actinocorallia sp. A-T 12471]MDX6743383.1 NUDIX hydrolase [Actinocorallia sp. A-T 12471]